MTIVKLFTSIRNVFTYKRSYRPSTRSLTAGSILGSIKNFVKPFPLDLMILNIFSNLCDSDSAFGSYAHTETPDGSGLSWWTTCQYGNTKHEV